MKQILTIVLFGLATMSQAQNPYQLAKVTNNEVCINSFYEIIGGNDYRVYNINPTEHHIYEVRLEGTSDIQVTTSEGKLLLQEIQKIRVVKPIVIYIKNVSKRRIKVAIAIMAINS